MNPTILEGDVVWIDKLAYSLRVPLTTIHLRQWSEPARGDIVVVLSPEDETRLIKRVVGIPGDTLAMKNNRLILNGEFVAYTEPLIDYTPLISEIYRPHAHFAEEVLDDRTHAVMGLAGGTGTRRNFAPITVPKDQYFLMGDSRDTSHDSRAYGFAKRDAVLGQAKGIVVSLDINDTYLPRFGRFFSKLR
jgi:signal peptidase I